MPSRRIHMKVDKVAKKLGFIDDDFDTELVHGIKDLGTTEVGELHRESNFHGQSRSVASRLAKGEEVKSGFLADNGNKGFMAKLDMRQNHDDLVVATKDQRNWDRTDMLHDATDSLSSFGKRLRRLI